jgi:hypothetical protein
MRSMVEGHVPPSQSPPHRTNRSVRFHAETRRRGEPLRRDRPIRCRQLAAENAPVLREPRMASRCADPEGFLRVLIERDRLLDVAWEVASMLKVYRIVKAINRPCRQRLSPPCH